MFEKIVENVYFTGQNDTERDFFMTAQEALDYGLIDKILTS